MLPKKRKVSRRLFPSLLRKGRVFHSPHFTARALVAKEGENTRCAVIVSKSVAKSAAQRGTLKRRAYTILRSLSADVSYPLVVASHAKSGATTIPFEEIQREITHLYSQMGALRAR